MRSRVIVRDGQKVKRVKTARDRCVCGKVCYSSRKLAAAKAAELSKAAGEPIQAYHCARGGHCFHIGHPIGWHRDRLERMAS